MGGGEGLVRGVAATGAIAPASPRRPLRRPRSSRRPSLGTMLVLLCVALPVVLMAAGAWVAWRNTWAEAEQDLRQGAETIAEYGLRVLTLHAVAAGRMDALLRGLSDAEIRAREAELHAELKRLVDEIPETEAGYVVDRDGAALVGANIFPVPRTSRPAADRDFFQALSGPNPPEVHVSRIYVSRFDAIPFFAVSRRRTQTGNADLPAGAFDGLVNISIFPARLAEGLRRLKGSRTDVASLIREDGELLARSVGQTGPVQVQGAFPERAGREPRDALYDDVSAVDGVRRLHAMHRIEGWPVYGVVGRSRADILAAWRQQVAEQLFIGVPATVLLLALALAVRRSQAALESRVAERTADLAASEARLHAALGAGHVFAFELDAGADIVLRSPNAAGILGLPEPVAIRDSGTAFLAAVHPDDRDRVDAALSLATPARPAYSVRFRYRRPDGGVVWLQDEGVVQFGPDGRMARVTSLARDVTAEVEAEAAARKAGLRLRAATEGAGVGTYEIDLVQRAALFDPRAAELAGSTLPAETWVGLGGAEWAGLEASIHPEDRAAYEVAWRGMLAGSSDGYALESRFRCPDGSWRWVWCHGISLERDASTGRPRRVVGMLLDVTERHRLADEMRHGQKLQALGELAGGIAHDVNNVLQAISGFAAMADRETGNPDAVHRRLAAVAAAVSRGSAITHRLLAFARRDERRAEAVDPAALLIGLKEILTPALGPQIAIRVEATAGLPPLLADCEALQTVLINLATNARDAMPQGGMLTLSAVSDRMVGGEGQGEGASVRPAPGHYLRLSVSDTGTGMDEATVARVAEPFFTTKPAGKGTGLGLSMARAFAESAGGRFAIESAPGKGTTVTLWLPQTDLAVSGNSAANAVPDLASCACRVLLVDDEPVVRATLAEQLEATGCRVVAEGDAAAALALLDAGHPVDAIVTDMTMPGMDGMSLIREAQARRPGLPAVLVTGHAEPVGTPTTTSGSGLSAVFRKPVAVAELAACLAALVKV